MIEKKIVKNMICDIADYIRDAYEDNGKSFDDGRTVSAVKDSDIKKILEINVNSINTTLLKYKDKDHIGVKLIVPDKIRFWYDFAIKISLLNGNTIILPVNIKNKNDDSKSYDNVNGGIALVAHLFGIKAKKKVNREELVSTVISKNICDVINDYYLLEFSGKLDKYKVISILDIGKNMVINASQTWPGLQYPSNQGKCWSENEISQNDKNKIVFGWLKSYSDSFNIKADNMKKLALHLENIYNKGAKNEQDSKNNV